ncbi:MAG TPA: biliverdin-producing heme oxygenase [Steroidobacteraceae bacterium]|nr:biliverdin-producing heme oxygenase [Steroidobacteraceae bacterium]
MSAATPLLRSLHEDLRAGTAARHAALDASLTTAGCTDSLAGYAGFLCGTARFRFGVETALEAAGVETLLDDWPDRRRGPLLIDDLVALGHPLPEAPEAEAPALVQGDLARLVGMAYVLEGSVLGGALLSRRAAPLGVDRFAGASYLQSCADAVKGWSRFLDRLKCVDTPSFDRRSAIAAARETFEFAGACYAAVR